MEYFIHAEDWEGGVGSYPTGIKNPFTYSGDGVKVLTFGEKRDGLMVVGDEDRENDKETVRFYLPEKIEFGHRVKLEVYESNRDFTNIVNSFPALTVPNVVFSGMPGSYEAVCEGVGLVPGNYLYQLVEEDEVFKKVRSLVGLRRLRVVRPLADVAVFVSPLGEKDRVRVQAAGTARN